MNKKVLIVIIAVVAALAIAVTGTLGYFIVKYAINSGNKPEDYKDTSTVSKLEDTSDSSAPTTSSTPAQSSQQSGGSSPDTVPPSNSGITTMTVGNVSAAKGSIVKVPVDVSSNQGFMGCFFKFNYNTQDLRYTGFKKTSLLTDYQVQETNGVIKFMTLENANVTKNGTLIYLEFEVIGNSGKTCPVLLTIDKTGIANKQEQYVPVKTAHGSVTIN